MKQPFISIIVPVYKVEEYLDNCLSSIISQSYREFEVILVDDGSPDTCPVLCDKWAKKDSRIIVIHKRNGGLSDARNYGLKRATGDYVWFVDSDDWICADALAILADTILKNPSLTLIQFLLSEVKENGETKIYNKGLYKGSCSFSNSDYVRKGLALFPVMQFLIRRDVLTNNNLSFIKGVLHEDIPFGHMLISYSKNVHTISNILYNYRIRPSSISNKPSIKNCYFLVDSYRIDKKFLHDNVKIADKTWYTSLLYDYFYEIFLRTYPFIWKYDYKIFMQENGQFLKSEFNTIKKSLGLKRRLLLSVFNISPIIYSFLIYQKRNR